MSSSSDSGRFSGVRAPEKYSNFSQTCNLLSQYLKEKGTIGDLSLGITRGFEGNNGMTAVTAASPTMNLFPVAKNSGISTRTLTSMDLFPQQSGFGSKASKEEVPKKKVDYSVKKAEPETAQMTIFYAGQVIVFNDFPADKAKEVMLMASNGSSKSPGMFASTLVQKPIEPANLIPSSPGPVVPIFCNSMIQELTQQTPQPIVNEVPIARKASLTRFLEKRKDRITARAPYPASNSTTIPSKPAAESMSWLGLAAQSSV